MKRVVFYYVRHGRTEYNRDGVIQGGRVDSPLVEGSLDAVRATEEALAPIALAACWCSPLGRAQETARIVLGDRDLTPKPLESLREFDFGELDGKPHRHNERAFASCFLHQDFSSVGGETGDEVRSRVRSAFKKMYRAARDGDSVLVVGHGAYLRYVILELAQMSNASKWIASRTMRAGNASITTVVCEDGVYNITSMPVPARKFRPLR